MAHITRSGEAAGVRIGTLAAAFFIFSFSVFGQSPTCTASASSPTLHAEGLTEQIGDITVTCSGGAGLIPTLLAIAVNGNVTNRLDANGNLTNITLTGSGSSPVPPTLNSNNTVVFNSALVSGAGVFGISGIRVAIPTLTGTSAPLFVNASVYGSQLSISTGPVVVGVTAPTLLSSVANYGVPCLGSPLPSTLDFPSLVAAGTSSSAVRITEASVAAFAPKSATADTGMRFLITLSGYGPNAQIFVPDVIVGNIPPSPTSAGAFNSVISGGSFTPGSNQFLLTRINNADATGAGGALFLPTAPAGTQSFTSVTKVPLVNGAGTVTYEVLVSNPSLVDSAQIPVFVVVPPSSCSTAQANTLAVTVAPTSSVSIPTQADPIPRFVATVPSSDCAVIGDCTASYVPVLQVAPATITMNGSSLGQPQANIIAVTDGGSQATQLSFNISASYQNATNQSVANWLSINGTQVSSTTNITGIVDPAAGIPAFNLNLSASPAALLIPGAYQATITINGGSAGTFTVPVTFNVGPAGPTIQAVVNSANSQPGAVTGGSYATLYGLNLVATQKATVTFNGFNAPISYDGQPTASSPSQINVLVPAGLVPAATAGVTATIDGVASNTFVVQLVPNAPAVFNPGILNQNNSINLASAPASRGDIIQIFLTGITTPITLPVTLTIGSVTIPGSPTVYQVYTGLEQINVQVPTGLTFTGDSAPLTICVPATNGQPTCSAPVPLYLK
jgi:uncharacterized protein (TIGR03437 family)